MGLSPIETYEAIKSLIKSGDIVGNVADSIKQSYIERIDRLVTEYERAGASGSFKAGVEAGTGLGNSFDKEAVQKEIDLQRDVSQAFSKNTQEAAGELKKRMVLNDALFEAGLISEQERDTRNSSLRNYAWILETVAAGLATPSNSVAGSLVAAASPTVAKEIGQQFKQTGQEGSTGHYLAHAGLGALVAAATGNSIAGNALAAAGAEAAAPIAASWIYGKDVGQLTPDEKATVSSIAGLAGAGLAGAAGGDGRSLVSGSVAGRTAVENNYLSADQTLQFDKELAECRQSGAECQPVIDKWKKISDSQSAVLDERLKDHPMTAQELDKKYAQGGFEMTECPNWLRYTGAATMTSDEAKAYVQQWNGQDLAKIDQNSPTWSKFAAFASDPENQFAMLSMGGLAKDLTAAAISYMGRNTATATVSAEKIGLVWGKDIQKQGMPWEDYVGKSLPADARLPKSFKTFDYYNGATKTAISVKSLDTQTLSRLNKPNQLYRSVKGNIDDVVNFEEYRVSGKILTSSMIKNKEIQLAIPANTTKIQWTEINRAVEYGKYQDVKVIVTQVK